MSENPKDYSNLDSRSFALRFFNPSPGNPIVNSMSFDDKYIYAFWSDGIRTKTTLDKVEEQFDEDTDEEIGVTLWFDGYSLFLGKEEDSDDDEESSEGMDEPDTEDED